MNNRQNGRRRGRGGQQARNGQPGGPDRGNRIDNRARGNAAQLLEKYKNLARDAQMQGDRVNTEYYLQFADHYFRVLNENRARFEEQRPRQNDYRDDFSGEDEAGEAPQSRYQGREDQGGEESWGEGEQPRAERRDSRHERRAYREETEEESDGAPQEERVAREERAPREERASREERTPREPRRERGRRSSANGHANGNGFAAPDFLNEAIAPRLDLEPATEDSEASAPAAEAEPTEEAAPKRRRTRRPRGEATAAEA